MEFDVAAAIRVGERWGASDAQIGAAAAGCLLLQACDEIERLKKCVNALAQMARRSHYDCDDNWYACPLSGSGCSDPVYAKDECNCGAAEHNRQLDAILSAKVQ